MCALYKRVDRYVFPAKDFVAEGITGMPDLYLSGVRNKTVQKLMFGYMKIFHMKGRDWK